LVIALVAAVIIALVLLIPIVGRRAEEQPPAVPPTNPSTTLAAPTSVVNTVASDLPCPNPDGAYANHCTGVLDAGTYHTTAFEPPFTYTAPAGWANMEDDSGNYLLLPPGQDLSRFYIASWDARLELRPAVADYVGVYASVSAPAGCKEYPDPAVATNAQAY